jgi:hypothetical protein
VKLFTALSEADADLAERGALRGDHVWVDDPAVGPAPEGSVWVMIDVPDNRTAKFEQRSDVGGWGGPDPRAEHREFLLPSRLTNLHRPQRVTRPR